MPDGHDEVVSHEDVDLAGLDGVVLVDVPERLQHQEQAVLVLLQLRPLVGLDGVLDRQVVQAEGLGHVGQLVRGGLVEAHPDEVTRLGGLGADGVVLVRQTVHADPLPLAVERAVDDHTSQGRARDRSLLFATWRR
jgi:hypothetical protein